MMRDRGRRIVLSALAAVTALGLAGCNAIPGSGPVEAGLSDLRQAEQFVQFNPLGPVDGSSQEDIVRGFVLAASSNEGDYAVAREFLAPAYADQWDPSLGVLVDDGPRLYESDGETTGVLELSAIAKVDTQGELLPLAPGPNTDMRFEFEQIDGEWRIVSAPAGIILDRTTFTAVWSPHQVYFVSAAGLLVAESRWYLSRASLATEIVNGLLTGPSERMAEVLHSGFPSGTALATSAVTVVDGRARIDLTAEAIEAGPEAVSEMYAQIRESLKSVPAVIGFDVLVNGSVALQETNNGALQPRVPTIETSSPTVIQGGAFGRIEHGEFVEDARLGAAIMEDDPSSVTLSADGELAAVLGPGGVTRVTADSHTLVNSAPNLIAPDLDLYGYVWSASTAGELWVSGPTGDGLMLPATWLKGLGATVIQVSPDGSRVAAFSQSGEYGIVSVAGVVRDQNGAPVRTTEQADVRMWVEGEATDFDWIDTVRFTTLARDDGSSDVVVGGTGLLWNEQGVVAGGTQIASGGSRSQLRVLASDGELYVSQGSGWQRLTSAIELLAKQE